MHSTLISLPKLADVGDTTVLRQETVEIYNDKATFVMANKPPVLTTPRCNLTGLWKLALEPKQVKNGHNEDNNSPTDAINVVFDLPSACQTFFWYHTTVDFPTKETFLRAV
jgi:hypothetical protein